MSMLPDFNLNNNTLLFTPGPITTSVYVKGATFTDLGSKESAFVAETQQIMEKLLKLAQVSSPEYETVLMQGSGTFGIESVISSAIPSNGMLLNIVNGAYGRRISKIARIHSIPLVELVYDENQLPDLKEIEALCSSNNKITHVAMVHCETNTGLLNPINEIGELAALCNKIFIVDAMSTFGAYDINMKTLNISYLISSSNKCIEGIPGFSFILVKRSELDNCKYQVRSLSLDLYDQWVSLKTKGHFRFTPPVQSLLAFREALDELRKEGGINGRAERYSVNNAILVGEMKELGFETYLPAYMRSYITTSFLFPDYPGFSFDRFYSMLIEKGFVIFPEKPSKANCFNIGNIGHVYPTDIQNLVDAIDSVLYELRIELVGS